MTAWLLTLACQAYDTDPGTPYVSEQGTESDSVSSGPMSPTVSTMASGATWALTAGQDDFLYRELPISAKASFPSSLHEHRTFPAVQIFRRQFLVPADAPKSRPFSFEVGHTRDHIHMANAPLNRISTLFMIYLTKRASSTTSSSAREIRAIRWKLKAARR